MKLEGLISPTSRNDIPLMKKKNCSIIDDP